jgi:uncharacterized protein (UPF0261 family)
VTVLVIGTADTKAAELAFLAERIRALGVPARIVDVSTSGDAVRGTDVSSGAVAAAHPGGPAAVFTGERGGAVAGMAEALSRWLPQQAGVSGAIGIGGSGGTALIAPALRALPVGVPKMLVSTVAAGDVRAHVGASDLVMAPSVTDIAGLNRISRLVLANAAAAIAGMAAAPRPDAADDRPAVGMTMFGVTTACVSQLAENLGADYDCIVFHATGTGGRTMEDLAAQGRLDGVVDVTTTELCDRLAGGIMPAGPDRIDRLAPLGLPYLGSCGALDMVNFAARDSVPARYRDRLLHVHNPQITLMRTTPEENALIGAGIAASLNRFEGPVRFLIPEGGVSALDAPGQPFHDPEADAALFDAIERDLREDDRRRLLRLPWHINEPAFAAAVADAFRGLMTEGKR